MIDAYFGAGSTDEDLELVITPDVTDPALCDAMLDFMRVIRDTKFPGSDRVLADTVTEINKS